MHPFAEFIQILGKGRNGMRPLSHEQAYTAMKMIAAGEVKAEQLGAFLMLMRVKEETAEEVAGFTEALRENFSNREGMQQPSIDWAAYAGKKRQLPWFILAALTAAARGHSVLMHGMERSDERIYVPRALAALGMNSANSLQEAERQLKMRGFAYLPVAKFSPLTAELIATRELFGLRPPLHTVARMLNPLAAPLSVMGVFHPNFSAIHQQAALLMGQSRALICKGEGGEFERVPDRKVEIYGLSNAELWQDTWEPIVKPGGMVKPEFLDLDHFCAVWEGKAEDRYGERAVIGTLALLIKALGLEEAPADAHVLAGEWWQRRHDADLNQGAA